MAHKSRSTKQAKQRARAQKRAEKRRARKPNGANLLPQIRGAQPPSSSAWQGKGFSFEAYLAKLERRRSPGVIARHSPVYTTRGAEVLDKLLRVGETSKQHSQLKSRALRGRGVIAVNGRMTDYGRKAA